MGERELDVVIERVTDATAKTSLRRTAATGAGIVVLALVCAALGLSPIAVFVMLGLGGITLRAGLGAATERTRYRTRTQTVRITGSAVETENATIPIASIAQAYVQRNEGQRPTVRLVDRVGAPLFEAAFETEREGDDFLRALDRDVQHHRETWKVVGPLVATGPRRGAVFIGAILASIAMSAALSAIGVATAIGIIAATVLFFGSFAVATRSAEVDVGADGLLLRWLSTTRFVPWNEVTNVDYGRNDTVQVAVKGQRSLHFEEPAARSPRTAAARALVHASLRARIVEAWQAHNAGETATLDQLARGGRDVGEWRLGLASLRGADGGYRTGAMRDEDLWRVVENASAPEDARAAAALALRTAEDAPVRLRVAAEAVASPGLRIALETAADREAEDAALDEALARVSARE